MMDMSVPGVCQSDDLEAALASARHLTQASVQGAGVTDLSATPNDNGPDQSGPEDCFCCCSHIAPTSFFYIARPFSLVGSGAPYAVGSPHDFSPPFYHPPKD